jgi:type II secretory pathway pseudopilin PulG
MTSTQLRRRLVAQPHRDQAGFTIVETMVALMVVFGMLVSLAYVVTAGLRYQAIARERQQATGIANQVMEQVRGLAYEKVTQGLLSTDLTGDSNIVSCSGTYRLFSCTPGSIVGSGEAIVSSPGLTSAAPLVPHRSSTAPNADIVLNGRTYSWATYVSQDQSDPDVSTPYRVTVLVTWTGGTGDAIVRLQSLFWSPNGCKNKATHPFAAPCQAFFFGKANAPSGAIAVSGNLVGSTVSGSLLLAGTDASAQHEQLAQAGAGVHASEATLTDSSGTRTAGGRLAGASADNDPGTVTGEYGRAGCGWSGLTCVGGTPVTPSTGGSNQMSLNATSTTVGDAIAASAATGGSTPCPIPTTTQTDKLPCAGGQVRQSGTMSVVANINGTSPAVGSMTLARVLEPGAVTTASVDRVADPKPAGAFCNPVAETAGCLDVQTNRSVGTINVGSLPSSFTAPAGWWTTGPAAAQGYLMSIVGYQDSAQAALGVGAPAPTTSLGGTLYYFDTATNSYQSLALDAVGGLNRSISLTQSISGTDVKVEISTVADEMISGSTASSSTPSGGGDLERTDVSASVTAPIVTVTYKVTKESNPKATWLDMTIQVNLGTLEATGVYAPEPAAGS